MTTNLWTVGQGLVTRRLVPRTPLGAGRAGPKTLGARSRRPTPGGNGARKERRSRSPRRPRSRSRRSRRAASSGRRAARASDRRPERSRSRRPARPSARRSGRRCASSSGSTPSLDKAAVRFQVLSEGERGLLGVGYTPARVLATRRRRTPRRPGAGGAGRRERGRGARARRCSSTSRPRSASAAAIEIDEDDERLDGDLLRRRPRAADRQARRRRSTRCRCSRARSRAAAPTSGSDVVVDAAGYRDRRRRTLEALARAERRGGAARRARASRSSR